MGSIGYSGQYEVILTELESTLEKVSGNHAQVSA